MTTQARTKIDANPGGPRERRSASLRSRLAAGVAAGALLLIPAASRGQGATQGGALPLPLPLFPADNWWNVDVSHAPADPASGAFVQFIGAARGMHPDFGGDSSPFPEIYGMPYATVPGGQPLVPVDFDFADESDAGAPGRPAGYPIPSAAITQPKWIESGYPGNDDQGGDRHMLIVDRDHRILFELFDLRWNAGSGRWNAGSGAIWPLDRNLRRPDGWTSADAAGLAILPGLVRYDEAYGPAPIRHAFRVTVRSTNGYVFPGSHRAGSTSGALPMGARLRLKAAKDISGFAPPLQRIFQAMKTYGLIVADNGSDLFVTGTYDTRWDNDLLNPAFASLHGSDFEVIQLGWQPASGGGGGGGGCSGPTPPCVANDTTLCLRNGRFEATSSWRAFDGSTGSGHTVPMTDESGIFWFFQPSNLEMLIKVLDGCAYNHEYWVFGAATTNVEYTLTVTDTATGCTSVHSNPLGVTSPAITDTTALAVCP